MALPVGALARRLAAVKMAAGNRQQPQRTRQSGASATIDATSRVSSHRPRNPERQYTHCPEIKQITRNNASDPCRLQRPQFARKIAPSTDSTAAANHPRALRYQLSGMTPTGNFGESAKLRPFETGGTDVRRTYLRLYVCIERTWRCYASELQPWRAPRGTQGARARDSRIAIGARAVRTVSAPKCAKASRAPRASAIGRPTGRRPARRWRWTGGSRAWKRTTRSKASSNLHCRNQQTASAPREVGVGSIGANTEPGGCIPRRIRIANSTNGTDHHLYTAGSSRTDGKACFDRASAANRSRLDLQAVNPLGEDAGHYQRRPPRPHRTIRADTLVDPRVLAHPLTMNWIRACAPGASAIRDEVQHDGLVEISTARRRLRG